MGGLANNEQGGLMKMKQLSQASGLPVSTIKFYMAKGLLVLPEKEKPNVVYYDEAFLRRLLVIKNMRQEGMSVTGTIFAHARGRRKPTNSGMRSVSRP
jgi:hypothetical protein